MSNKRLIDEKTIRKLGHLKFEKGEIIQRYFLIHELLINGYDLKIGKFKRKDSTKYRIIDIIKDNKVLFNSDKIKDGFFDKSKDRIRYLDWIINNTVIDILKELNYSFTFKPNHNVDNKTVSLYLFKNRFKHVYFNNKEINECDILKESNLIDQIISKMGRGYSINLNKKILLSYETFPDYLLVPLENESTDSSIIEFEFSE